MARAISIGAQGFEDMREHGDFYVDKTAFVREWWDSGDAVTIVCRPRRFGKTLGLDTVRCFLSTEFAGRGEELFGGLDVWEGGTPEERKRMRALQGTVPVFSLTFACVKSRTYESMLTWVAMAIGNAVREHRDLLEWDGLSDADRAWLHDVLLRDAADAQACAGAVRRFCGLLERFHGRKPVVLLDEYDSPMEGAWAGGYWDEAAAFMHDFMAATFGDNPFLERGLVVGIVRLPEDPFLSGIGGLKVMTTLSTPYRESFGFTQAEVDAALVEYGRTEERQDVRKYYGGFTIGGLGDIHNPWATTCYLNMGGIYQAYWSDTAGTQLISDVVLRGGAGLIADVGELMLGGTITKAFDERLALPELASRPDAVWALLLAAGYVTCPGPVPDDAGAPRPLALTNSDVGVAYRRMVQGWVGMADGDLYDFVRSLFRGDMYSASGYMEDVLFDCAPRFNLGENPTEEGLAGFWRGMALVLFEELRSHSVEPVRESGRGRYDVVLVPKDDAAEADPAVVIEFKLFDSERDGEETLEDTVAHAHARIEERGYVADLVERGIDPERILTYGVAFRGMEVLAG